MKKHFALVTFALLLLAASALAQGGDKMMKPKAGKPSLEQALIAKEKETWEAYKRKDEGVLTTKAQQIQSISDLTISDYTMQDVKVVMLSKDSAIVMYKVMAKGSYKGKAFEPHWALASAVWANRGGKWQNVLYQETAIKQN
jgi:hypothetical protein